MAGSVVCTEGCVGSGEVAEVEVWWIDVDEIILDFPVWGDVFGVEGLGGESEARAEVGIGFGEDGDGVGQREGGVGGESWDGDDLDFGGAEEDSIAIPVDESVEIGRGAEVVGDGCAELSGLSGFQDGREGDAILVIDGGKVIGIGEERRLSVVLVIELVSQVDFLGWEVIGR